MRILDFIKYFPLILFSHLPIKVLYSISSLLYILFYHVFSYRKKVVIENLTQAFPTKSQSELQSIAKEFYKHFCDLMVEVLKSASLSRKSFPIHFKYVNPDLPEDFLMRGKSITLYAAHLGNWEWLISLPIPFANPVYGIYLPLSNPYFDNFMILFRERFGMHCVPAAKAYKFLLDRWKEGEKNVSLFIGDQSPPGPDNAHWTTFLNQKTAFIKGTEAIARRNANAVFFPKVIKQSRGRYIVEFELLWDGLETLSENQLTERFARALEQAILSQPAYWLWSHRRWKHSKTTPD